MISFSRGKVEFWGNRFNFCWSPKDANIFGGFFLIFVLIYAQSKQLRWFGKYTRIVYLFGEELELCGNYCNIFRSMNFMSADGQSI